MCPSAPSEREPAPGDWDALWRQGDTPTPPTPRSDTEVLRELFGAVEEHPPRTKQSSREGWPGHNYNAAYESLSARVRRQTTPRQPGSRNRLEVWDVDEALPEPRREEPAAEPQEPPGAPLPPWSEEPAPRVAADAGAWLDLVARSATTPETTEAQIVRTLWGDPRRVSAPAFETSDVLHARPRRPIERAAPRLVVRVPARHATTPRRLRVALVGLLGFALGVAMGLATMMLLFG